MPNIIKINLVEIQWVTLEQRKKEKIPNIPNLQS